MMNWSGGGSDGRGSGHIGFQPLDPMAAKLTVAPTAATTRALIDRLKVKPGPGSGGFERRQR
jgi:hypothetical protein